MKVVIAPDSFKESMTAQEAALRIEKGLKKIGGDRIKTEIIPMADGGEGTARSLRDALGGTMHYTTVTGPDGQPVRASYAILKDGHTAVIEMAEASGLEKLPRARRNPLITTTFGTGELIQAAVKHGVKRIIMGIGGSATNDGGAGMIQALGGKLLDKDGQELGHGGAALSRLDRIDLSDFDQRLKHVEMITACDVNNPLTGPNGASAVYGPQKGADQEMVRTLDHALQNYARVIEKELGRNVEQMPGAGAAGGLGAGLSAFLHTELSPGIEIVLKETRFGDRVKHADLVITGEGKIDRQSVQGKTPVGVAKAVSRCSKAPVIALCGQLGEGYEEVCSHGITAVFSISRGPEDIKSSLANGPENIERLSRNIAAVWLLDKSK